MPAARTRKRAQDARTFENRYDAAGMGRRVKGWTPPSSGPQRAVEGLQKVRDRARDTVRNDWAGESGVQKWTSNLVGVGITPRWEDERHTAIWDDFVPQADADGVLDVYGLQTLGVRAWLSAGEVFERQRFRSLDSPLALPLQVQLIESDFCPIFDADTWPGMPAGNKIRQGIELNKYGRRVAYWFYRDHPGDKPASSRPSAADLIRVAASEVSHVFEPSRPGQLRGVSSLAPILVKLRASMDFEDAVLDRQKLANLFTMFITRQMPQSWADIDTDSITGLPKWYDAAGRVLAGLEPGISHELAPGEDVKFANPPEAGTSYPDYMRTTHMGTAAGQGLPYELFSGDIRDISDRTLRIAINEFRRFARQRQWQIVIPMLCQPAVRWLGEAAVLAGRLRASEFDKFVKPTWSPQGWEYIHPVQDVEGKLKARDGGLISTSQLISEQGDDPRKVLKQIKADKASGLTPEPAVAPGAPGAPAPAPMPAKKPATTAELDGVMASLKALHAVVSGPQASQPAASQSAIESALGTMVATITAQQAANEALMKSFAEIALQLAGRPLEVRNDVHPAPVNPTPVDVHVAAPTVDVTVAPTPIENHLHVEPTPVQITNENTVEIAEGALKVDLPDRRIETEMIDRDGAGNLTRVVQTERTIN